MIFAKPKCKISILGWSLFLEDWFRIGSNSCLNDSLLDLTGNRLNLINLDEINVYEIGLFLGETD